MIKLESISKHFDVGGHSVTALDDVSLEVPKSSIVGVIGASGAGKSTLIRCVNGLESVTSGSVWVDGQDITQLKASALRDARRSIGMIFQHFNLLSSRTVYDNVALPLELAGVSKDEIQAAVAPLLELTGLSSKRDQYPAQLSGGQKQRVAIARALANKPKVLLCDEATSALDPKTTQQILALLKDINEKLGLTILLITHEMEVVKSICDTVAVISDGRIVEHAPVAQIFMQPKNDVTRDFVDNALHQRLPDDLVKRMSKSSTGDNDPIVRLTFTGGSENQPLVSSISREYDVDLSIIQSSIEQVHGLSMGFLIARLSGQQVDNALKAMQKHEAVNVEVLGYVV